MGEDGLISEVWRMLESLPSGSRRPVESGWLSVWSWLLSVSTVGPLPDLSERSPPSSDGSAYDENKKLNNFDAKT